jgi:glyoxylate reductase
MPSSSKKKPLVIVTRKLPDAIETRLMELFDTRLNPDDKPLSATQLVEASKAADVLVPTVTDRIDSRILSQAGPRLKRSPRSAALTTSSRFGATARHPPSPHAGRC